MSLLSLANWFVPNLLIVLFVWLILVAHVRYSPSWFDDRSSVFEMNSGSRLSGIAITSRVPLDLFGRVPKETQLLAVFPHPQRRNQIKGWTACTQILQTPVI